MTGSRIAIRPVEAILLFALLLITAGCGVAADRVSVSGASCWTGTLVEAGARCGFVTVPGSYDDPNGPTREIAFAVKPPIDPAVGDGAVPAVFLIGGPGLSATYYSEIDGYEPHELDFLNRDRELVLVDYRGVGETRPVLDCDFTPDLADCNAALVASGLGPELRAATIARDIDRVLAALGYEKVVLYGESWGTRLALTMMRDVPDRISHVVLDGVFPPEMGLRDDPIAALANLDYLAAACERHVECPKVLGDIRAKIAQIVERWSGRDDAGDLIAAVAAVARFPAAPLLAHELWSRDADEAADMARQIHVLTHEVFDESPVDQAESFLMMITLVCAEEANLLEAHGPPDTSPFGFSGLALDTIAGHTYGAPVSPEQAAAMCASLDVAAAPAVEVAPVYSDIPTLLISAGMDMDTSIAWGAIAASRLSNSQHLVFPFSGHVAAMSDTCPREIAEQFVRDPASRLQRACLDRDLSRSADLVLHSPDVLAEIRHFIPDTLSTQ